MTLVFTDMELGVEVRRRVLTVESRVALQQFSFRLSCVGAASTDTPTTWSPVWLDDRNHTTGHVVLVAPA